MFLTEKICFILVVCHECKIVDEKHMNYNKYTSFGNVNEYTTGKI